MLPSLLVMRLKYAACLTQMYWTWNGSHINNSTVVSTHRSTWLLFVWIPNTRSQHSTRKCAVTLVFMSTLHTQNTTQNNKTIQCWVGDFDRTVCNTILISSQFFVLHWFACKRNKNKNGNSEVIQNPLGKVSKFESSGSSKSGTFARKKILYRFCIDNHLSQCFFGIYILCVYSCHNTTTSTLIWTI